jgi:peptide/nickel transport system substrate-binding protein
MRAQEPIRVGLNSTVRLNPVVVYSEDQNEVLDLVFDRLITMDLQGNFIGQILESWTLSPDNREMTLKVRPGLKWHDERPLDADDILFTWKMLRQPKILEWADNQAASIPSMEKVDSLTLRIKLARPRVTLFADLYNFIPVPRTFPPIVDPRRHPYDLAPIGSGPYRLDPSSTDKHLVLTRWPGYRGPHPGTWPKIEFILTAGAGPVAKQVESGRLDFGESGQWLEHYLARTGASAFHNVIPLQGTRDGFSALWFNCDPKLSLLGDVRLRRALAELYPWDAISKVRSVRPVLVAGCIWPPSSLAYDPTPRPLPRRQMAESYLDEAGWHRGQDGWRRNAKGQELRLEYMHTISASTDFILSSFVASARECGIRIEERVMDFHPIEEAQQEGKGDIWLTAWSNNGPDPNGDRRLFTSDGIPIINFTRYRNPVVDQLFDDGLHATDPEQRALIYRRINQTLLADRPLLLLDYQQYFGFQNRRLRPVTYNKRGLVYGWVPGMRAWALEK